jgi:hypothetical protein
VAGAYGRTNTALLSESISSLFDGDDAFDATDLMPAYSIQQEFGGRILRRFYRSRKGAEAYGLAAHSATQ